MPDLAPIIVPALLLIGALALFAAWRRARLRRLAMERLDRAAASATGAGDDAALDAGGDVLRFRPNPLWPLLAAAVVFASMLFLTGRPLISGVIALVAGTVTLILLEIGADRRSLRLEEQLADSIDLIVSGLRAGVGVLDALDVTVREIRKPLRPVLEEVLGRMRLGDEPGTVFEDLSRRVPLESFRLFSFTLAVHWEVGGSLAPTLATVGRTIRDRIEVSRRARTQSAEAQFSVIGILGIVYFLGLMMWQSDPGRVAGFLGTEAGNFVVAAVILLQAVGLFWMKRVSKLPY